MKTYAPKGLEGADLRDLLTALVCTPQEAAKFLHVTERSVWRWLADGSAPFAVLAALWHETPRGREVTSCDVVNDLVLTRTGQRIAQDGQARAVGQLARVLAISDTGAANDALLQGPWGVAPLFPNPVFERRILPDDPGRNQCAAQHNQSFAAQFRQ